MAAPDRAALVAYARQAAQRNGINPDVFVAQIQQESGFSSTAHNPSGASGIAQLMPQYYPNVDTSDPYASLDAAARTDAANLKQFGGDYAKMLAAYDAGAGAVEKYGGVPPFEETQRYVRTIMGTMQAGGGSDSQGIIDAAIGDATAPSGASASTSADSTSAGTYSPQKWQDFIAEHGGKITSNQPTRYTSGALGKKPVGGSPLLVTFADGTHVTAVFNSDGSVDLTDRGTALASSKPPTAYGAASSSDPFVVWYDAQGQQHKDSNPNYTAPATIGGQPVDAFNAQTSRDTSQANITHQQISDALAQANNALAQQTQMIDNAYKQGTLSLDQAKFAYQQAHDRVTDDLTRQTQMIQARGQDLSFTSNAQTQIGENRRALLPYMSVRGTAETLAKDWGNVSQGAGFRPSPLPTTSTPPYDPNDLGTSIALQALAKISPLAAQHLGQQGPGTGLVLPQPASGGTQQPQPQQPMPTSASGGPMIPPSFGRPGGPF